MLHNTYETLGDIRKRWRQQSIVCILYNIYNVTVLENLISVSSWFWLIHLPSSRFTVYGGGASTVVSAILLPSCWVFAWTLVGESITGICWTLPPCRETVWIGSWLATINICLFGHCTYWESEWMWQAGCEIYATCGQLLALFSEHTPL